MDQYMNIPPDPAEEPDAPAVLQMGNLITTASRQVEKRKLREISYDLEVTDVHGNVVKGHGVIVGADAKRGFLGGR